MAGDLIVTDETFNDNAIMRRLLNDLIERVDSDVLTTITPELLAKIVQIVEVDGDAIPPTVQDGGIDTDKIVDDAITKQIVVVSVSGSSGSQSVAYLDPFVPDIIASITIPDTAEGSEITIDYSTLFQTTLFNTTNSSSTARSIGIDGYGSIYASNKGGIPLPATGELFALTGITFATGTGGDIVIDMYCNLLMLAAGSANWNYTYSDIRFTAIERLR